jgi:uncharacterized protein (DUF849 family)
VKSEFINKCYRILIEPESEEINSALKTIDEIEEILNNYFVKTPRLLHGFNEVVWNILKEAKKRGYDSRIGMEDTIFLENGELAKSNYELLKNANTIINSI